MEQKDHVINQVEVSSTESQVLDINASEISTKMKSQFLDTYNIAVNLFSIGKYQEAKSKFLDCMIYNIESDKCLKSIASCCQMLEEYDEAINFYKVSFMYDDKQNLDCAQYIGVCAVKNKNYKEAVEYLQQYLELVDKVDDNKDKIKSANMYLTIANKKLNETNEETSSLDAE